MHDMKNRSMKREDEGEAEGQGTRAHQKRRAGFAGK